MTGRSRSSWNAEPPRPRPARETGLGRQAGAPGEHPPLVLASGSPRRAQLLAMLGLRFEVVPAQVDESMQPGEEPAPHVERLAREKTGLIAARRPEALVVGSDTIVVVNGEVLGKPRDDQEALRMLLRLQGREHRVETGIAVAAPGGRMGSAVEGVMVRFRSFSRQTARDYVATGEPRDKAGAYGIQGYGAALVERIDGDFFAVMGLPVARLISLFEAVGWRYNFRELRPV